MSARPCGSRIRRGGFSPLFLLALVLPSGPLSARLPVQEVSGSVVAENRRVTHPKVLEQVILVSKELPGEHNSLALRYWRTSARKSDQGRVLVDVEIRRPTGANGASQLLAEFEGKGPVGSRVFALSLSSLPALREGDLIFVSFRFRKMPAIPRSEGVFAEAILRTE